MHDYGCLAYPSQAWSSLVIPEFRRDCVIHTDSYDTTFAPKLDQEEQEETELGRLVRYDAGD
ncbi:hypothetical protein OMCYN_01607 [cyanobiont of Ornithocercus magnificus]|nr:hypothetical protein OMCYN_01607 [cyanobiont of Ornithocercus magnificus]